MCTYVETPDTRILLDAGVSLCPNRFGLPPHPLEFKAVLEARKKIAAAAEKAEIITISHYHYDHVTPSFEDWLCNWTEANETAKQIYEEKTVLAKNSRDHINHSQRERGWMFQTTAGKYAGKLITADSKTFTFNNTQIRFSEPVFHGSDNSELGWVLMAIIEFQGEKFVFAPDVQGPMSTRTLDIIAKEKPQLAMVGGPPLYLAGSRVAENQIQAGLNNLGAVAETIPHVIVEHHILRDEKWREKTMNLYYRTYKAGHTLQTAAEFTGEKNTFLEAIRKELYEKHPPSKDFKKWMHMGEEAMRHAKPPL